MSLYLLGPILLGTLLLGWVAGMWTRKRSDHWCPVDGSQLRCVLCLERPTELVQSVGVHQ